jgi:hypothetical protein
VAQLVHLHNTEIGMLLDGLGELEHWHNQSPVVLQGTNAESIERLKSLQSKLAALYQR